MIWKSLGQMVRFSIKPGDQKDKTESANLVKKTGIAKRWVPNKAVSISVNFGLKTN